MLALIIKVRCYCTAAGTCSRIKKVTITGNTTNRSDFLRSGKFGITSKNLPLQVIPNGMGWIDTLETMTSAQPIPCRIKGAPH